MKNKVKEIATIFSLNGHYKGIIYGGGECKKNRENYVIHQVQKNFPNLKGFTYYAPIPNFPIKGKTIIFE